MRFTLYLLKSIMFSLRVLKNRLPKLNPVSTYFMSNKITNMPFKYPEVRRDESVVDDFFGTKVPDPYRWLEDPDSDETKAFVDAQNAVTDPFLDGYEHKDKIKEKITKSWNYPKYSTPYRWGGKYFQNRNTGLQNQDVMYVMDELNGEAKVFLDPNALSEDGTIALSGTKFSEDGKTFAYGLSSNGSDWIDIKFKDVATGKDYPEVLKKVKYTTMSWMHDNKGFFYGAYFNQTGKTDGSETDLHENHNLFYHKLGTDQSEDKLVAAFDDPQIRVSAAVSHCGNYLLVGAMKGCSHNLLYFAKLQPDQKFDEKLTLTPIVTEFTADYEYITNVGNKFYFRTNKNSPNFRIIEIDINNPAESKWKDFIPEHKKDVLDWAYIVNKNKLIVCYLKDVKNVLQIFDLDTGKKIHDFNLDVGTISEISGTRFDDEMFFGFFSFLTPNIIYRVNFEGDKIKETVFHETKVGDFDQSLYETKQVFYKSKDGTEIPMFIVHKKGFVNDGTKPCLLYGYGGFGIKFTPYFSPIQLVFIDSFDGIFALANIRGGGEYGEKWHNDGRLENKQNSFNDFQSAAKYLVSEKYTSIDKLTIEGGSNGGLLVAACINQAPHLFGAALCEVPLTDMLRFHKFTIGYVWSSEYGSPEDENQFKYLFKYSPLHNVQIPKEGQYPATLLTTADHDDRAVPLHSFKYIAELQYKIGRLPKQTNPLMVRIEKQAGHGIGKPTSKIIDEVTATFCFVSRALNLKYHE